MRTICVVSGKGGVGKTTAAINIAHALTKHKKILLVDANLTTPNVHIYLGWPILKKSLVNYLSDEKSVKEAIFTHETGLRILPSISSVQELKNLKYHRLKYLVRELEGEADIILFDSAAGLGKEAVSAIEACDEVLIITNPELGAVLDAQKTIQVAQEMGKTILGVVLNKVRGDRHELGVYEVERLLDLPVIGIVPFDDKVRRALKNSMPVTHTNPRSKAAKKFKDTALVLSGVKIAGKRKLREYILQKLGLA